MIVFFDWPKQGYPLKVFLLLFLSLQSLMAEDRGPPFNLPKPPPIPEDVLNSNPGKPPENLPDPNELINQLKQLDDLLKMPADQLKRLRQTIEFIEKMTDTEREAMRIRLSQVTRMTPELSSEISSLYRKYKGNFSKNDLSQFWLSISDKERSSLRDFFKTNSIPKAKERLAEKVVRFVEKRDSAFQKFQNNLELKKNKTPLPGTP